jgi:FkbM family methyltransferase
MSLLSSLISVRGHALSKLGLGPCSIVVDAGAHRGEFSSALVNQFKCRCYLVEANPILAAALRDDARFEASVEAALGVRDGNTKFFLRDNPEAASVFACDGEQAVAALDVEVVSLPTLMHRFDLDRIDVLKLDIEGSEFEILQQTPDDLLKNIHQITVEFHDAIPPFSGRGLYQQTRERLGELGFTCCPIAIRTHGDVLFLNRRQFAIGPVRSIGLSMFARWSLRLSSRRK